MTGLRWHYQTAMDRMSNRNLQYCQKITDEDIDDLLRSVLEYVEFLENSPEFQKLYERIGALEDKIGEMEDENNEIEWKSDLLFKENEKLILEIYRLQKENNDLRKSKNGRRIYT